MNDYIQAMINRRNKVKSNEYIDWVYNFVRNFPGCLNDESFLYKENSPDKENVLLLSSFCSYVEDLANIQRVANVPSEFNEFENIRFVIKIYDTFFAISNMVGQGSITFIEKCEKPNHAYVTIIDNVKTNKNYSFNAKEVRKDIVNWIRQIRDETTMENVVIGMSGGKDSTIAASLCVEALGKEHVFGLLMPNGEQNDIVDSLNICNVLGINYEILNIKPIYDAEVNMLEKVSDEAILNIPPRIRMTTLYAWGQTNKCRVCGTGNKSELLMGYFTKWGDGASDFNPLADLTTVEVIAIGDTFENIPTKYIHKTPADGLSGLSDEEKLGILYRDIHSFVRKTNELNYKTKTKIGSKILDSEHKRLPIPIFHQKI